MNFLKKIFNKETSIKTTLTITSSNGFHLRPIAKFANEAKRFDATVTIVAYEEEVTATQVPKILSLSLEKGESFTLKCTGNEAQKACDKLSDFFNRLMNEDHQAEVLVQEDEHYEARTHTGVSISSGIAIAPLIQAHVVQTENKSKTLSISSAIEEVKKELEKLYYDNKDNSEAEIYLAHKALLSSELFDQAFNNTQSFKETINQEIEKLKNGKFESRIADYQDLQQRILAHTGISTSLDLPSTPYILFTDDLLPSDVPKINETPIKGVVLKKGTPTSHASILLRSFAIPSVIIHEEINQASNAILDTSSGSLVIEPTDNDLKKAEQKERTYAKTKEKNYENRFKSTQTLRGIQIKVLANIGGVDSAKEAKEFGADGIGLLRSEFLFMEKRPTLEEQTKVYSEIFKLFDDITIRMLDIGGDKPLPYVSIEKENNPFLGLRGIRFLLEEKTLLKAQLLAIFKAVEATPSENKQIKIMFPMVNNCSEFIEAKQIGLEIAKKEKLDISQIQFGIMLEVPSVIFAINEFDKFVDFYSIGTNDLTQYLFAIDRTHPILQADATSPMVMNALRMIINNTKKPISICGELAGLADATEELVSMGYSTLSVSSQLIPSLKERIRNV